jgi:hypothetical protein
MENVVVIKGPSAFGNSIMFCALKQTLATLGMIWRTVFIWPPYSRRSTVRTNLIIWFVFV